SCFELAMLLEKAKKKSKGDKVALFACKRMTGNECTIKEAIKLRDEHLKSKMEMEKAKERLILENDKSKSDDQVKCEQGQGDACGRAGIYYEYLAPQVDAARARRLFERGCDLKDASSCNSLELMRKGIGKVYHVDVSTPADERPAGTP